MIRVMVIAPWARRLGGAESMLATFAGAVDRARVELHLVFLERGPWADELTGAGQRVSALAPSRLRDPASTASAVRALAALIRTHSPDVLLNWSAKTHLYGAAAVAVSGRRTPTVWWQHMIPNGGWLDRLASALPAVAIGCSSRAAAEAQGRIWRRSQTFVVHPGVEWERSCASLMPQRPRGGSFVVGLVGNLQPWKGQDRLLRAQAILRSEGHDVVVLLVGGDPYGRSSAYIAELHQLIRAHQLADSVVFTGHVADIQPHLAAMDVFVSASTGEPFGIALVEAMSLGLPVVAVADAGPAEIVEPGRSGLLVGSPSADELAGALRRLIEERELRQKLASGARERAQTHFSAERMCRELENRLELVALGR